MLAGFGHYFFCTQTGTCWFIRAGLVSDTVLSVIRKIVVRTAAVPDPVRVRDKPPAVLPAVLLMLSTCKGTCTSEWTSKACPD